MRAKAIGNSTAVVYTQLSAGYDTLVAPPRALSKEVEFLCFSESGSPVRGWTIRQQPLGDQRPAFMRNRDVKIRCLASVGEYDYSVYIDGNISIVGDIAEALSEFKASRAAIGLVPHPYRRSLSEEADACISRNKIGPAELPALEAQLGRYRADGLPEDHILTENNVIFRWHRHPDLELMSELWWKEFLTGVKRDQISLPYVIWKTGARPHYWRWDTRTNTPYFRAHRHRSSWLDDVEVWLDVNSYGNRMRRYVYRWFRRMRKLSATRLTP